MLDLCCVQYVQRSTFQSVPTRSVQQSVVQLLIMITAGFPLSLCVIQRQQHQHHHHHQRPLHVSLKLFIVQAAQQYRSTKFRFRFPRQNRQKYKFQLGFVFGRLGQNKFRFWPNLSVGFCLHQFFCFAFYCCCGELDVDTVSAQCTPEPVSIMLHRDPRPRQLQHLSTGLTDIHVIQFCGKTVACNSIRAIRASYY